MNQTLFIKHLIMFFLRHCFLVQNEFVGQVFRILVGCNRYPLFLIPYQSTIHPSDISAMTVLFNSGIILSFYVQVFRGTPSFCGVREKTYICKETIPFIRRYGH